MELSEPKTIMMGIRKDFGYSTKPVRQIDLDRPLGSLAVALEQAIPVSLSCMNCGACAASCTAGLSIRNIHYQIRLNERAADHLLTLAHCQLCGKCQLVCPRGIPTRYLALKIMNHIANHGEDIPSV